KEISDNAFAVCSSLKSVDLPGSITEMGRGVFSSCRKLADVKLEEGIEIIGDTAFNSCISLSQMDLPDSVMMIGSYAVNGTAYYNNTENWENGELYLEGHLLDLQNPVSTSYTVKEGTKSIAGSVFYNAGQLTQIQLPDSLVSIGNNAFY